MALFSSLLKQEGIPKKFDLGKNFPNPFNSKTKIKYSLPFKTKVTILINNSEGKTVEKFISNSQEAGRYELEFFADGLPKGTYFFHLVADKYSSSKEMEIIK